MTKLDILNIRDRFPALSRRINERPAIYFDGPAGSQVPRVVADAVYHYLLHTNANTHGEFITSKESDDMLRDAHSAAADFLGIEDPDLTIFGPNMTTLTLALSRALAKTWAKGDKILVSRLDHDANVTPWILAAADAGAQVEHIDVRKSDCTLDMDDLRAKLTDNTKLVAVGAAANATGTVNPIEEIADLCHAQNAQLFVDAVHYAPHRLIDAPRWKADFVACSAYKFFGPHVGLLFGTREVMSALTAYQVRPAQTGLPGSWMTGTPNLEGIAGVTAAIDYLAELSGEPPPKSSRRDRLRAAYHKLEDHENGLLTRLLGGLSEISGIRVVGINDPARLKERVPTVSIVHDRHTPQAIAKQLAERGIFVWNGNFYALPLTEALGLEPHGMVRIGLLHYNTTDEVDALLEALSKL